MLKTLTMIAAIGAASAALTVGANAMPMAPATQLGADSNLTLVRDGCGRGMRYSYGRDRCVGQFNRGRRAFGRGHRRGFDGRDAAAAVIHGLFGGHRRHNRRHGGRW